MNIPFSSRRMGRFTLAACSLLVAACDSSPAQDPNAQKPASAEVAAQPALYSEKYRPQFHFSPQSGWMGDPDGLLFHDGFYHLFWWGHAVSRDLVHWTELPFPMRGDDGTFDYYTGSLVFDKSDSARYGQPRLVAAYTMHAKSGGVQSVGLSSSRDGVDFLFDEKSPVLNIGSKDFRDPQVFRHDETSRWVMVIARPQQRKIAFYSSPDLRAWKHESDFGPLGALGANWETPDLFQLPVEGQGSGKKWVLSVGVGPNKTQYFTGAFDGRRFQIDAPLQAFLRRGEGVRGEVFARFDNGYDGWKTSGTAFGNAPSRAAMPLHLGSGQADSFGGDDKETGTLTSPQFTIEKRAINFLIGGGEHPEKTCLNLLVDGKIVRSSTGNNAPGLVWDGWDVTDLRGRKAQLQIVDEYSGNDYGHINVDHIVFADAPTSHRNEHALWADGGSDFYAARTWRGNEKAPVTWLAWLGNWDYANDVPTSWGKGFASLPRVLSLAPSPTGGLLHLVQKPLPALQSLRENEIKIAARPLAVGRTPLREFQPQRNVYELEAEFDVSTQGTFGLNLCVGEGRKLVVGYDAARRELFLDRTRTSDFSGNANFARRFARRTAMPFTPRGETLRLQIFVDQSSVEVFADGGAAVMSATTFPAENQTAVELFAEGEKARLKSLRAWPLRSIWQRDEKLLTLRGAGHLAVGETTLNAKTPFDFTVEAQYPDEYSLRVTGSGAAQFQLEENGRVLTRTLMADDKSVDSTLFALGFGRRNLRLRVLSGAITLRDIAFLPSPKNAPIQGTYRITARHSARVLDAAGKAAGAAVQQWKWLDNDNQKWRLEAADNGSFRLLARNGGLALSTQKVENGATLQLQEAGGATLWTLQPLGGGYFSVAAANTDKVLDVREYSQKDGGVVQLWENLDGASQQWQFERLP